jgi:N-methylhydantoinase A
VPPGPGVLCAYGDATTQVQDEAARTYLTMAGDLSDEQLVADLHELRDRARESLLADGIAAEEQEVTYQADLRYAGQAFQITVDFSEEELREKGVALLTEAFDAEHEQLFTFKLGDGHEILMIRAVVKARLAHRRPRARRGRDSDLDRPGPRQPLLRDGAWHEAPIYDRERLAAGMRCPDPASSEMDSTTVVLPGYTRRVDAVGNLLINPEQLRTPVCQPQLSRATQPLETV